MPKSNVGVPHLEHLGRSMELECGVVGRPLLHVVALCEMNSLSVIFTANQKAPNENLFPDNLLNLVS
jgi:hypothetical protein